MLKIVSCITKLTFVFCAACKRPGISRKAAVRKIGILFANAWVLTVTKWTPRVLVYIDLSGI